MRKLLLFALVVGVATTLATSQPAVSQDKKDPEIIVPYVPTHEKVVTAMLKLAGVKAGETVYDLGCGDGRIVITAVKDFKAKRGLGVDFNPVRLQDCLVSLAKTDFTPEKTATINMTYAQKKLDGIKFNLDNKQTIDFKQGDVLKMTADDFKDVDVVTLYLLPEVNLRLMPVLQKGLKPGSRIVSHDFDMGDWKEDKKEEVSADRTHTIYLWTIKKGK
jgi:SAM-dependent methyltransferase